MLSAESSKFFFGISNIPWPGTSCFPLYSSSGNGLPLANKQRPSVYLTASSKVHSLLLDGFDSGKTIGRLFNAPIFSKISGVNAPPMVERPIRMVGLM
jgi:hypothetical protein